MSNTSLDIRQSQTRVLQDQLNSAATTQMDSTLASVNSELTSPCRLIAAATPSYSVTVGSYLVVNPNTSKNRVIPFINNTPVSNFTGNTIVFPSTAGGGNITWTGGAVAISTVASSYYAVLVQLTSSGTLSLSVGPASGSISGITIPTGSSQALNLGYIIASTNTSNIINVITNSMIYQMPLGSGGGSASGSGTGDDLDALQYQTDVSEAFLYSPTGTANYSSVDTTQSNATYSSTGPYEVLSYDANKTVTGSGTTMTMSAAPAYTVAVGDILRVGTQAKKITAVASQTSYTVESAFTTTPSASACCVSQAVYSKDLNNFAFNTVALSSIYTGSISDCLVTYNDTTSGTNYNYTDPSLIGYTASADGSSYTTVQSREANLSATLGVTSLPSTASNMYVRFFSNASTGAGSVYLTNYKVFFHRNTLTESGGIQYQSLCFTNSVGTPVGCSNPTVSGGKTTIALTNSYPVGVNSGYANGGLIVVLNGQKIPRFINSTLTPDASYTETNANTIQLDRDYSSYNYSVEAYQFVAVVDSNTQNTTNISTINSHKFRNYVINGNFDFWQRNTSVTITASTGYTADRWFASSGTGSGAVTVSQQAFTLGQTVVPNEPTYFYRYNQTGTPSGTPRATQRIESVRTLAGKTVTLTFWAKANSAQTLGVILEQNFGSGGSPSSAVDSAQQNATLTTSFQQFTMVFTLPSISGKTLGTAGDYLEIQFIMPTGATYIIDMAQVMLNEGGTAAPWVYASGGTSLNFQAELSMCQRYYEKSYDLGVVPGTSGSTALNTARGDNALTTSDFYTIGIQSFKVTKRIAPTVVIYSGSSGTSGKLYDQQAAADVTASTGQIGTTLFKAGGASTLTAGHYYYWHWSADGEL